MKKSYISPKARLINLDNTIMQVTSTPDVDTENPVPEIPGGVSGGSKKNMINGIVWFETEED